MNFNNQYSEIKKLRKKEAIKKRIVFTFICVILSVIMFFLGFGSALVMTNNVQIINKIIPTNNKGDILAKSSGQQEEKNNTDKELIYLEALKNDMIDTVKAKYPSVDLSFAIKNLDTGASVTFDNKKMNSASIIKLFIMETVYDKISDKEYKLTKEKEKELEFMITQSKNGAANLFIDDFGGVNEKRKVPETNIINQNILKHGYEFTELNRKMHDTTPPEGPSGYQNYTSAGDVVKLLEGIYHKKHFDEPYNTYAVNLLKNQQRRSKIPKKISEKYNDVTVANKTGELSQVENDAALIMCEDFNLAFVVLIDNIPLNADGSTNYSLKNEVQDTISDLGLMLVDFYKENNI